MREYCQQREILEIAPYKSLKHCIFSLDTLEERRIQEEVSRQEYATFLHKKLAPFKRGILTSLILFTGFSIYSERQTISDKLNSFTDSVYQKYEKLINFPTSLLKDDFDTGL